jgi:hypothetical protein
MMPRVYEEYFCLSKTTVELSGKSMEVPNYKIAPQGSN